MAYGSGDFRQLNIIQASDFARVYDVEPITSGFGDFVGPTQQMKHKVQSGETLGTISARYYGTSAKFMDIFNANRSLLALRGANYLEPGWELVIPAVPIPQVAKVEAAKISQTAALQVKAEEKSWIKENKLLLIAGLVLLAAFFVLKKSK
jgi:LysM repeat protein